MEVDNEKLIGISTLTLKLPEQSEWKCYMFGGNEYGMAYLPRKGQEPNWFWRWMQYLCFGHKWVKGDK